MIFYLIGFMGAGKSTVGKYAARHNELDFVDLDTWIEFKEGKSIPHIFEDNGEAAFREMERNALHEVTESHSHVLISCGGGTPCYFDNMAFMNAHGKTLYLDMSSGRLTDRLRKAKTPRPLLKEIEGDLQVWIHKKLMERAAFYGMAQYIIPEHQTDKKSVRELIGNILVEG